MDVPDPAVRFRIVLPPAPRLVPLVRGVARQLLRSLLTPADAALAVQVALGEACANVVRYANGDDYAVEVELGPDWCAVVVRDHGPPFDPPEHDPDRLPPEESGRGIYLMRMLTDEIEFAREGEENTVAFRVTWEPEAAAASA